MFLEHVFEFVFNFIAINHIKKKQKENFSAAHRSFYDKQRNTPYGMR